MILGSFGLQFAFFAQFMHFRSKTRYDLRSFSWGKFIWKELICVKNLTFRNSACIHVSLNSVIMGQSNEQHHEHPTNKETLDICQQLSSLILRVVRDLIQKGSWCCNFYWFKLFWSRFFVLIWL